MPSAPASSQREPARYAVVGHPVAHSRSPFIHARFAEQTGEPITYTAIDVVPQRFEVEIGRFRERGGRGLNVTVPLKELAFACATALSPRARRAGAVNTLRFDPGGEVLGDNTDGVGLLRDLEVNHGFALAGRRVLLLGAGGAARGALGPLLDRSPARVVVANRTVARAQALAEAFGGRAKLGASALDAIPRERFELVINATASSIEGANLPLAAGHLAAQALCYDMMYGPRPTAFLQQAAALGAGRAVDGRGMLVEQAAESFLVWRGVRPRTAPVIEALTRALEGG